MKSKACSKTYQGRCVLDVGEMTWQPGRIYVLIGANGSGKSTFAKILAGVLTSDQKTPVLPREVSVGYLPQRPYAFRMSLEKNLSIAAKDPARAEELIGALLLTEIRDKGGKSLSGGETARMALARVLMRPFDLLILDEPSAAMDMESTKRAEEVIRSYRDRTGAAVLLVTHSIGQARRLGDEVLFFREGHLRERGDCAVHLAEPETAELRAFLDFYG